MSLTYEQLLEKVYEEKPAETIMNPMVTVLHHEMGHEGMGINLGHFGGDGSFEVVSRYNKDGELIETAIVFADEQDEIDLNITKTQKHGFVDVDSGQLLIADPCYVLENDAKCRIL